MFSIQFRALFSMSPPQQALAYVCNPSTDPSDFLEIPVGINIDADKLRNNFCSIDWEMVVGELMTNLEVYEIQQQVPDMCSFSVFFVRYYL